MRANCTYLYFGNNPNQNVYPPQLPGFLPGGSGSGFVSTTGQYGYVKRIGNPPQQVAQNFGDVLCQIENESASLSTTLTINTSSDNGQTDAYSGHALSFLVNGSLVSSLVLPAGAHQSFIIVAVAGPVTRPYYRFTTTLNTKGKIGLASFNDLFDLRNIEGVP
jgi:hypothetical protein